jgi:hypothetical protein
MPEVTFTPRVSVSRMVLVQAEDPAVGQPQALPHRVAALDYRVEGRHPGLVTVGQLAAHVD